MAEIKWKETRRGDTVYRVADEHSIFRSVADFIASVQAAATGLQNPKISITSSVEFAGELDASSYCDIEIEGTLLSEEPK